MNIREQLEAQGIRVLSGNLRLQAALSNGLEICLGQDDEGRWVHVKQEGEKVVVRREPMQLQVVFDPKPKQHGPNGDDPDCLCNDCTAGIGDGP